jgi:integrase
MTPTTPDMTPEAYPHPENARDPSVLRHTNPLVLSNRPLRDGTGPTTRLSRFGDSVWDLTPGIFEEHSTKTTLTFDVFPEQWRDHIKAYFWALINVDVFRPLASGPAESRPSLRTISFAKPHLLRFLTWCDGAQITDLAHCTGEVLDRLIGDLADTELTYDQRRHIITEVRRLWTYRDLCPPVLALPVPSPWLDERPYDLFGRPPQPSTNRTPRISDATLVPLITWSLRFVEEFADDIVRSFDQYRDLIRHEYRHRPTDLQPPLTTYTRKKRLRLALRELRALGLGIPGRVLPDGTREIRWQHLGRLAQGPANSYRVYDKQVLTRAHLHIDDDAYLTTECHGTLDGEIWHRRFLSWDEIFPLVTHLQTACFTIVSYFSGMRPGEVLSLTRGCLTYDDTRDLWTLTGTRWKGARGTDGNKALPGAPRQNPWVVHSAAAAAIRVLHQLAPGRLLFPITLRPQPIRGIEHRENLRPGKARTSSQLGTDLTNFTTWVNEHCARRSRLDTIPPDPQGPLNGTRFRRTLAWHIVRTPRGLVAGAIQYGHLAKHVTQGYGGTYDSGFPDELAMERWLERIEQVGDLNQYLDDGGHVSGPAADELRQRTRTAARFLGRKIPTRRQAERLLRDPSVQIYPGDGMHCVYHQPSALCAPTHSDAGPEDEAPVLAQCQSACTNIARTDGDIAALDTRVQDLKSDPLAPSIRHQRARSVAENLRTSITEHERSRMP